VDTCSTVTVVIARAGVNWQIGAKFASFITLRFLQVLSSHRVSFRSRDDSDLKLSRA
jgi:hypothetical protein